MESEKKEKTSQKAWVIYLTLFIIYCSTQAWDCVNKGYADLAVAFTAIASVILGVMIQKIFKFL